MKANRTLIDNLGRRLLAKAAASTASTDTAALDRRLAAKCTLALEKWTAEKLYCESETMGEAVERLGLHQRELSWYMKRYLNTSFSAWRRNLRIQEAQRIMDEDPALPISCVATLVGIPDKSNFKREFRAVAGVTPSEWKARAK